jgi:hypothetical protein
MRELERINAVKEAHGEQAALEFAERTMNTYRKAVLHSAKRGAAKPHFASANVWKETYIRSYLELKRYVLSQRPDALLTPEERQAKIEAARVEYAREQARLHLANMLTNVEAGMKIRINKLRSLYRNDNTKTFLVGPEIDLFSASGRTKLCNQYGISYRVLNNKQIILSATFVIGGVCGNVNMYADVNTCLTDLIMRALIIGSQAKKI